MRNIAFIILSIGVFFSVNGQTNTFPSSGNVGIGTTNPDSNLKVIGTTTIGGRWNPSNSIFTLSDGSNSLIMDTNEYYGSNTLYFGTKSGDIMRLRTVSNTGASDKVIFKANGDVGIGTTAPAGKLHVSSATSGDAIFRLEADTDNDNESDNPLIQFRQDGGIIGANMGFSENFGENKFGIGTRNTTNGPAEVWNTFIIDIGSNNIGIGTNNPGSYKLAVNGNIRAKEIKVETGWADYVFKKGYDLPTLEEVEKHIKEKGHLINIPSAKEVEANGIELGEMNKLLLEKIEELTLYIIDQKKEIEKVDILRKEVKELKQLALNIKK